MPWGEIAAFLVTLAGGLLSSWLAARIFPLDHVPEQTADFASLKAKYRRWQLGLAGVWLCFLLPAASIVTWRVLTRCAETWYGRLGRAQIAFFPGFIEWGFPAVFLAGVISIVLLWTGIRIFLGPRYEEYSRYEALQWNLSPWTLWLGLIGLVAGPALFAAALLDCYVLFTPDRIRINELFSAGERTYSYQDVRVIRTAPKWTALAGNEVDRREYVICFHDGSSWSTIWTPGIVPPHGRRQLAEWVSVRAEVPIVEMSVLTGDARSCR
jgi:hypothetical protein